MCVGLLQEHNPKNVLHRLIGGSKLSLGVCASDCVALHQTVNPSRVFTVTGIGSSNLVPPNGIKKIVGWMDNQQYTLKLTVLSIQLLVRFSH